MSLEQYIDWFLERNLNVEIISIYQFAEGLRGIKIVPTIASPIRFSDDEDNFFVERGLENCLEKAKKFIEDKCGDIDIEKCAEDKM